MTAGFSVGVIGPIDSKRSAGCFSRPGIEQSSLPRPGRPVFVLSRPDGSTYNQTSDVGPPFVAPIGLYVPRPPRFGVGACSAAWIVPFVFRTGREAHSDETDDPRASPRPALETGFLI